MSDRATVSSRDSRFARKPKAAALQALRAAVEPLENRLLFATAAYSAGVFTLNGLTASANNVTVTSPATNQVQIVLGAGDTFTSSPPSGDFALSQTINPNDTLTINTGPTNSPISTFNLDLGSAADTVNFSLPGTNGVSNVVIDTGANSDLVTIGTVNIDGNLQDTGGAITISPSAQVTTNGGNITLIGTGNSSDVVGVKVNGATLNAGGGSITLNGSGAGGAPSPGHIGVEIQGGALVETTGVGAVSISGTGGAGSGPSNEGVLITGTASVVAATGGISIAGTGAAAGSMNAGGVEIDAAVTVNATGAGGISITGAAVSGPGLGRFGVEVNDELTAVGNITVIGIGGGSNGSAFGVLLSANGTEVSSSNGAVTITGSGGFGPSSDYGVRTQGLIMAGTNVTITGTGAGTGGGSFGVNLTGNGTQVNAGGAVSITGKGAAGTGGDFGVRTTGAVSGSTGVTITGIGIATTGTGSEGVVLTSTGTDVSSSSGAVTISGTGAAGTGANYGVAIDGLVMAGTNVTITGTGAGTGAGSFGVALNGTGANVNSGGAVSITGSGAAGSTTDYGVKINGSVSASTGVTITGTGRGTGSGDFGVALTGTGADVTAGGVVTITGSGAATTTFGAGSDYGVLISGSVSGSTGVTITGTGAGNVAGSNNFGVDLSFTGTTVAAISGAVSISGTSSAVVGAEYGVRIDGTVMAGTNVTLTGTGGPGGAGGGNSIGIYLTNTGTDVASGSGAVSITGSGGHGAAVDRGVTIEGTVISGSDVTIIGTGGGLIGNSGGVFLDCTGSDVQSGGLATVTGSGPTMVGTSHNNDYGVRANGSVSGSAGVIITGTGTGTGAINNFGVYLAATGTAVASSSGAVSISGTGGPGTSTDFGVRIDGTVTAHVNVTITGTGGGNAGNSYGVYLANLGTDVSTSSGDVTITGTGAAGSGYNYGVWVDGTVMAGTNVTITGTGAGTGGNSFGVLLNNAGTDINSGGVVTITGSGPAAAGASTIADYGVRANGLVSGSLGVTITGTGTGDSGNFGVYLGDPTTAVASTSGAVAIYGTGAADGTYGDYGVRVDGTVMAGTDVTIIGTGGGTGSVSWGVLLDPTTPAVKSGGSVTITGSAAAGAGADANADYGVWITAPVSGSTGVTITGTGTGGGIGTGNDAANNFGVNLTSNGTAVASSSGAVSISGSGADGAGGDYGVQSYGTVTAGTNVTITGTSGEFGDGSFGVALVVTGTAVHAGGTVSITGSGAAGTSTDYGVYLKGGVSGSTGITITGTGSNSGPGTDAIYIAGAALTASAIITLDPSSGTALLPSGTTDTLTALSMNLKTGTLQVDAAVLGAGTPIIVEDNTTLDGTGSIAGTVELQSSATLIPGYSETPGILTIGGLSAVSGANVDFTVNGPTAGTGYSQLHVNGSVGVGSATLNLAGTILSSAGQTVTLIKNGGKSAVSGIFSGYIEGAPVTLNGLTFNISYIGGSGHDVVLSQGGVKAGPVIHAFDAGGVYNGAPFVSTGFVYVGTTPVATPVYTYYNLSDKALKNPLPGPPVNAGSYFFIAKFAGNSTYPPTQTSSGPITITKAQPVIHASDLGGVYNGKPYAATGFVYLGTNPVATPVFSYYNFSDKTESHPLSGAPTTPGKYFFTATYAGNGNLLSTSTSSGEFDITIPVTSFTASAVHVVVGATFNGVIAQFSAPAALAASFFTATINWGDGTASTVGTVSAEATKGKFQIVGSHNWSKKGPFTITITLLPTATAALTAKVTTS